MPDDTIFGIAHSGASFAKELAVKYARVPGTYIFVRPDRCNGCGTCVRKSFCRVNAISVQEKRARIDERRCRGCARCTHLCPRSALAIEVRPPAIIKGTLKRLDDAVNRII